MNEELKQRLLKRVKSLLWRSGCMLAVGLLALVSDNLLELKLPTVVVALAGLLLGEATKWVNSHTDLFGAKQK